MPLTGLQDALRSSQARGLASQLPRPEVLLQRWVCQCSTQTAVVSAPLQVQRDWPASCKGQCCRCKSGPASLTQ